LGAGTLLTITLIGAIIGIPLLIIGGFMAFASVFIPTTRVDPMIYPKSPGEASRALTASQLSLGLSLVAT
jgi:hypothetical protein